MDLVIRKSLENISIETETEIRLKVSKGEWGRTKRNWEEVDQVWVKSEVSRGEGRRMVWRHSFFQRGKGRKKEGGGRLFAENSSSTPL